MASTSGPSSFRVVDFDHIVLRVADVEASLEFYCDRLGLEAERVDGWRAGSVPFPSVRISAGVIIDLFKREGHDSGADAVRDLDHFCVVIDAEDLDAVAAEFTEPRRADQVFGARGVGDSVYVSDPDGNTVELRRYRIEPPRRFS